MTATLNQLAAEIHAISKAKGFWPAPEPGDGAGIDLKTQPQRNPGEVLMLIVTEVAEAMEAIRDGDPLGKLRFKGPTGLSQSRHHLYPKPVGVPSEMADIIIRVLDACAAWGIDIDAAVRAKVDYNATRDRLHGRQS